MATIRFEGVSKVYSDGTRAVDSLELGVFLAAMFIACLVPIAGFLVFQRSFMRGPGLSGAIKG